MAAPHDTDAFNTQVHERLNAVPRGQMCLLLGDFNASVRNTAADCFGNHAPVTENQNGERMREMLIENNVVALNTFFLGDPYTWTEVAGRPARMDYICASTHLLIATMWAGVRKDIEVRVGSAEDHWPIVADVYLSIGESRENKGTQTVSSDRSLAHDQQRVWNFQHHLDHVVLCEGLEIGPLCSALTADVAEAATACFKRIAKMSLEKTGNLRIPGCASSGLKVFVPICVTHERVSPACDSSSLSMLGGGLFLTIVMPTIRGVLQQLHSGSKEPS